MKILLMLTLGISTSVLAQDCPCCSESYRQFDFWIGEWKVYSATDQLIGTNRIELIEDQCALQEHWKSANSSGTSFSYYDTAAQKWKQLWIDNQGGNLSISGGLEGKNMVMFTERQENPANNTYFVDRITWSPNADGSVRQHWERQNDGQKEWSTVFDGLYKK